MLVESACGASLAAVYSSIIPALQAEGKLPPNLDNIVMIICGGNGISLDLLQTYKSMLETHSVPSK